MIGLTSLLVWTALPVFADDPLGPTHGGFRYLQ